MTFNSPSIITIIFPHLRMTFPTVLDLNGYVDREDEVTKNKWIFLILSPRNCPTPVINIVILIVCT